MSKKHRSASRARFLERQAALKADNPGLSKAGLDPLPMNPADFEPDWDGKCEVCDQSPIVPCTGMCGPCTFGEADTLGGNW